MDDGYRARRWEQTYREGRLPWDIGRPQPVFEELADAGQIVGPVLDVGCGTGENGLLVSARGMVVLGIDLSPTAIARAQDKARERGLDARFEVGDALRLEGLGQTFRTVIDCGTFHTFGDTARQRYVSGLGAVVKPGGVVHLLCFSDREPGSDGPRRVSAPEIRAAFGGGWRVERIEAARFAVRPDFRAQPPQAWLARIVRLSAALT